MTLLETNFMELPEFTARQAALMKEVIYSEFAAPLIAGEQTHEAALRLVAQLTSFGCDDSEIEEIVAALLPPGYEGNTLIELPEMIRGAREKGFDVGATDGENETLSKLVVDMAMGAGLDFFNNGDTAFVTVPKGNGKRTYAVNSSEFLQWLRYRAFVNFKRPISRATLSDVVATLESKAMFDGERRVVDLRIGGTEKFVEWDLGDDEGRILHISSEGWQVTLNGSSHFYRASGFEALPEPVKGDVLKSFQKLLGLDDNSFILLLAFIINALKPTGPYMALLIEGEQGSGKSFLCSFVKALIDPNKVAKLRLPENERDLMLQAKEYRLLVYDNASSMKPEISDFLCSLATGAAIAVRRLYTNDELHAVSNCRPFVVNGISGYAKRPDLLERAIPLKMQPMTDQQRKTEAEMNAEFEVLRPALIALLCDAVSAALGNLEKVEQPRNIRMADAARWISASESAFGFAPGTMVNAIAAAQNEIFVERINDDTLVVRIRELLDNAGVFEGYVGDLFKRIGGDIRSQDLSLPKTPSNLSSALERSRPSMARAGIIVEKLGKTKKGRLIRISLSEPAASKPWFRPEI